VPSPKKRNFAYGGNNDRMKPEVENLVSQGLIEFKSIPHEETGSRQVLTLTKNDYRFLTRTQSTVKGQGLYHGSIKPREAHHDADLYRLYRKAAAQIEGQRGRNLRVVLDHELKKHLYRALAKLSKDRNSDDGKHAIAERHGLQVDGGKAAVHDVRIEYETAMENGGAWTLNLPPVTTTVEISPKKYAQDCLSKLMRTIYQSSGGFWIS
jgi:hypothetical protein